MKKKYKLKKKKSLLITTFFVVLFCVGFSGVVAYQSKAANEPHLLTEEDLLIAQIQKIEKENNALEKDINSLQKRKQTFAANTYFETERILDLEAENRFLEEEAQYEEITGQSILITLNDNAEAAETEKRESPYTYEPENYIVHDKNILYLINELRPYAKGIAINNQRIVGFTNIRCVGTVIMLDQTRMAPPYKITVAGDSKVLMTALKNSAYYEELMNSDIIFTVSTENDVTLPSYTGRTPRNYSTILKEVSE